MVRSALPQNYVSGGTLFEDFETVGDWSVYTAGSIIAADVTNYKTGSAGLKLTAASAGANADAQKTISKKFGGGPVSIWLYIDQAQFVNLAGIKIFLSSSTVFSAYFGYYKTSGFGTGWQKITITPDMWNSNGGSPSWSNTMVRLMVRVYSASGKIASATFDSLYINEIFFTPRCLITFDDGVYDAIYDVAFAKMEPLDIPGTLYVISSTPWSGALAEWLEMQAAGWTIGNHTATHQDLSTLSYADQLSEMQTCKEWLDANGLNGGLHLAYPYGNSNYNTHIAAAALGMKTARSTVSYWLTPGGKSNIKLSLDMSVSLDTAKLVIDSAVSNKQSIVIVGHNLVETPSIATEWAIADFEALIDYISAYQQRGWLVCESIAGWYNGLTNPRYAAIPPTRAAAGSRAAATGRAIA